MRKVVLVGNDINSFGNSPNWEDVLKDIAKLYGNKIEFSTEKPFPLLYEEIYLSALNSNNINELEIKTRISELISNIRPNEIHNELLNLNLHDYITTNYDYSIQKILLDGKSTSILKNTGYVKESRYSIFRHNTIFNKNFWHIHGEVNVPNSIMLGFEHYGGQLQKLRNYTVTGTKYTKLKNNGVALQKRLLENKFYSDSWVELLFKEEIHIIGLKLDYEETDLWWLLTNRARFQLKKSNNCHNKIIYYCPEIYENKHKTAIMKAIDIEVKLIKYVGKKFYDEVLNIIRNDT
jgi:hypothetical protein